MRQSLVPIAFPQYQPQPDGTSILAVDIGGTKMDIAVFSMKDGVPVLLEEHRHPSRNWRSLVDVVEKFGEGERNKLVLSISFAGPVFEGKAYGTNLGWDMDCRSLRRELKLNTVHLINDLEANCYGLAALSKEELLCIHPGAEKPLGNGSMISPGTGLGEGGLYWDGKSFHPFATEGGHAHFAARNEFDWDLFRYLQNKYGHVSWERVISGPGIQEIFNFLHEVKKWEIPASLAEKLQEGDRSAAISQAAKDDVPIAKETMRLFTRYLAQEAANLAMKHNATGGMFMGGGILPKNWGAEQHVIFEKYFHDVGRMHPLVESVPVYLILNHKTAMLGAAYYGAFSGRHIG